jgi:hypothetical protein
MGQAAYGCCQLAQRHGPLSAPLGQAAPEHLPPPPLGPLSSMRTNPRPPRSGCTSRCGHPIARRNGWACSSVHSILGHKGCANPPGGA